MNQESVRFERVYRRTAMWRLFHWANVLSIVCCTLTGFYIANPFFTADIHYEMAWMPAFHFYAAIVLDLSVFSLAHLYFFSTVDRGVKQIAPTRSRASRGG